MPRVAISKLEMQEGSHEAGATAFGTGLAAGVALTTAQFQLLAAGAVNDTTASSGQVRFVWEADDERLWSDTNGNGAGGLVLLANLLDGATLGRSDLILVCGNWTKQTAARRPARCAKAPMWAETEPHI